jgi:fluoride exporter
VAVQHSMTDPAPREPVDSDVDLHLEPQRIRYRRGEVELLGVVASGGMVGAAGRYLVGQAWPTPVGGFPWATLVVNVTGCALIGVLMVLVTEVWIRQRLLRPFLGTGVLGGFTTFSTYTVDIQQLISNRHPGAALLYLAATVVGALVAVLGTANATRRSVTWRLR